VPTASFNELLVNSKNKSQLFKSSANTPFVKAPHKENNGITPTPPTHDFYTPFEKDTFPLFKRSATVPLVKAPNRKQSEKALPTYEFFTPVPAKESPVNLTDTLSINLVGSGVIEQGQINSDELPEMPSVNSIASSQRTIVSFDDSQEDTIQTNGTSASTVTSHTALHAVQSDHDTVHSSDSYFTAKSNRSESPLEIPSDVPPHPECGKQVDNWRWLNSGHTEFGAQQPTPSNLGETSPSAMMQHFLSDTVQSLPPIQPSSLSQESP